MASIHRPVVALAALFALTGCASGNLSQAQVETRSNCHMSTGEFVAAPSCSFSHSSTVSQTTTTTTTTTTSQPAQPTLDAGDDDSR